MSDSADIQQSAEKFRVLYEARAAAELDAADSLAPGSDVVGWRGALQADIAVVKGARGPAEASGGQALSGADGIAAVKALEALGFSEDSIFFTLSFPEPTMTDEQRSMRLRRQIEAVDPAVILALDREATRDLAAAFGIDRLPFGKAVRAQGRRLVAADGLEESLSEQSRKARVWRQMKAAKADPPVL